MVNKFKILDGWDGFRDVKLLEDGSCHFERRFFFRIVNATINPKFEFTDFKVSMNWVTSALFLFGTGPIWIIFIIITGLNTKKDVIHEIKEILANKRKKGGILAEIGRRQGWRED